MTLEIYKSFANGMRWSATTQVRGGGIIVPINDLATLSDEEAIVMLRMMVETAEYANACDLAYYILSLPSPGRYWYMSILKDVEEGGPAEALLRRFADQDDEIAEALALIDKARAEGRQRAIGRTTAKQTRKEAKSRYDSLFMEVGRRDGFACATCGYAGNDLQLDHVMPVAKGGTNDLGNLQLLCPPCNLAKSDR